MKLKNKVALITGGSKGIGKAIACRYAEEGARMAIVYRSDSTAADDLVDEINASGGEAKAFQADCSSLKEIQSLVREVKDSLGTINILVNNAGVFRTVPFTETTEAIWDEQLDTNLKGAFFLIKEVLPMFEANGGGKVVNISSIAGVAGFPNCAPYCASKAGLVNLSKALAVELSSLNININVIAPGNVATDINQHLRGPGNEAYVQAMRDRTPSGQAFLEPEDIAGAAVFLASDDASAVYGAVIAVDGGWTAW